VIPAGAHLTDERAQELVDGGVPPADAAVVAEHAAGCPECAALIESYRALSLQLDALPGPDLPGDFTSAVLARVEERERTVARERRTAMVVLGAVALGLVGALVVGGNGAWVPAATSLAERLGSTFNTLRLGAQVLPPVLNVLRLPIAAACAAMVLPLLLALSRLIPSPRTEAT